MSKRYQVKKFNAGYVHLVDTETDKGLGDYTKDDVGARELANLLNQQVAELREAQAGAAVLQEALEHYGVLYDSAFRTHKSGAELLRELDTLKDQNAKLRTAAEVAEVNLDIVLETESWFWENDRGGGLKGLLVEALKALKGE